MKPKGFFSKNIDTYIDFEESGEICFQNGYPTETARLSEYEAKQLFISMMNHYKIKDDIFWKES